METTWNRKDRTPQETVDYILDILSKNQIDVQITNEIMHKELWFSNRIEFVSYPGIGTNGKGISREYARASGYAEFLERIQSGMLLNGLFMKKVSASPVDSSKYDEIIKAIFTYFGQYFGEAQLEELEKIAHLRNGNYASLESYFSVSKKKVVHLPDRLVQSISGSNGLASGNTREEALAQGLGEIFERYVNMLIFRGEIEAFSTIPKEYYENMRSNTLIKEIESHKYTVIVKDCTLGGKVPVLGVLLLNPGKTKYLFRLGADLDFDICLQRCITEMFQGIDFIGLRVSMKAIDGIDSTNFWDLKECGKEYYRSIRNGSGHYPRTILRDRAYKYSLDTIKPFSRQKITNLEACREMLKIVLDMGFDAYIKDLSYLGFPTLRVYVPGMSDIIHYSNGFIKTQQLIQNTRILYDKFAAEQNRATAMDLLASLKELLKEELVDVDYKLSTLLGIYLLPNTDCSGILLQNIYYFSSLLALFVQETSLAFRWFHVFLEQENTAPKIQMLLHTAFEAVVSKVPAEHFIEYINAISTAEEAVMISAFYTKLQSIAGGEFNIPYCGSCEDCMIKGGCQYESITQLLNRLHQMKEEYEEINPYQNDFYGQI